MAEMTMKYRITKHYYGDDKFNIAFAIVGDDERGKSFIVLSKPEIKELIQDLLKCLRPGASIARAQNKC